MEVTLEGILNPTEAQFIDPKADSGPDSALGYSCLGSPIRGHLKSRHLRQLCCWCWVEENLTESRNISSSLVRICATEFFKILRLLKNNNCIIIHKNEAPPVSLAGICPIMSSPNAMLTLWVVLKIFLGHMTLDFLHRISTWPCQVKLLSGLVSGNHCPKLSLWLHCTQINCTGPDNPISSQCLLNKSCSWAMDTGSWRN